MQQVVRNHKPGHSETEMDCVSEFGSVVPCGDLRRGPRPLTLPELEFQWMGDTVEPWLWKSVVFIMSLSSVYTQALILVCSRKTYWKNEGLVSRISEPSSHSVYGTNSLGISRKR